MTTPSIPRPSTPRIPPLPPDERTEWQRELLDRLAGPPPNIFTTLVRHPGLYNKWTPFAGKVLNARLPDRDRELLILRTGWNCQAVYEWAQHVVIGREAGLSDAEIERVTQGPDADGWDPFDATLLRAADELHGGGCISDATWAELAARYDERQMIEVPVVVGQYHLVSFVLNSLGVPLDDGLTGFPS
jgi:alkylhydroperoxidase family enzyme